MIDRLARSFRHLALLAFSLGLPAPMLRAENAWNAAAQTVVVFNPNFQGSEALAIYYAEKRGIPRDQVVGIPCPTTDDVSRSDFESQLRSPLRKLFTTRHWLASGKNPAASPAPNAPTEPAPIRILALIRGVPFRVNRASDPKESGQEDEASVDAELMLLGMDQPRLPGHLPNPFFKSPLSFHEFDAAPGLLLVGRLDGPDDATVRRIIDDSINAETQGLIGRAVLDLALKDGPYEEGEEWLRQAAQLYRQAGIPCYIDRHADLLPENWPLPDTMLYFGWYRDRVGGALADPAFRFVPGAVACHLHSFSAARLRSPTEHWTGPLLMRGAAATVGNVWEPYLSLTCHLDLFNQRLQSGATLAEAAWAATPGLSWMQVVIGDPLYRPFLFPPGSRLGTDSAARDYALFHGLITRYPKDSEAPTLKKQLTRLAETRHSPRLLELLGLFSWQTGSTIEAADLFDHAASLHAAAPDRDRSRLYQAEALRQHQQTAAALKILESLPAHPAAQALASKLR